MEIYRKCNGDSVVVEKYYVKSTNITSGLHVNLITFHSLE